MYHNDNGMSSPMRRKHFFGDTLLLIAGFACFLIAGTIHQSTVKPVPNISKQDTALNINKDLLVFLSAGNKRFLTDLLWVQTLIESDLEHYSEHDLNGWMYVRFRTIAELDPKFYENYLWGGQYLSIVKDDLPGATSLMEKGLLLFPDDYRLNYNLGFSYYYELGDYKKGLKYLEKIQDNPRTPAHFRSLIMKMKVEMGFDYNAVLSLLYEYMMSTDEKELKEKLSGEFHSLKSERDIICLNEGRPNCELKDAYGLPYVKIAGKYHSQTPFLPYRLKKKGDYTKTKPVTTVDDSMKTQ